MRNNLSRAWPWLVRTTALLLLAAVLIDACYTAAFDWEWLLVAVLLLVLNEVHERGRSAA